MLPLQGFGIKSFKILSNTVINEKKSRREEALLGILFAGRKKAGEIIA